MLPRKQAVVHALKADFLSLTAWQAGMYAWMAVVIWVLFRETGLSKMSWTFWFMMQTAMFVGFLAALPMNVWLIRKGVKKGCSRAVRFGCLLCFNQVRIFPGAVRFQEVRSCRKCS